MVSGYLKKGDSGRRAPPREQVKGKKVTDGLR